MKLKTKENDMKNNNYKTWYNTETKQLVRWNEIPTKEWYRLNKEGKLKFVGTLQAHQNPYELQNGTIYRNLYNKKRDIMETSSL